MPELPEVETIRQDLVDKIIAKKIVKIDVFKEKLVKNSLDYFQNILINNFFTNIDRRGKLLVFSLEKKQRYLLWHLKMTGQLIYLSSQNKIISGGHNFPKINQPTQFPNKFTHLIFYFIDGSHLFYNDLRQFGYLKIVDQKEKDKILSDNFGIEPLTKEFTYQNFIKIFEKRKIVLKALLLNQKIIAGLGNIYVDEICFEAGVLPNRLVNSLTQTEKRKLFEACQNILKKAIKARGTTFSDYRDTQGKKGNFTEQLKVYWKSNQQCFRCWNLLKKVKLIARGTHFCDCCQK